MLRPTNGPSAADSIESEGVGAVALSLFIFALPAVVAIALVVGTLSMRPR